MENLDIYDSNMNYIGSENREVIHNKGLWHKTIHCWLYDSDGNIYFQIRKNSGKFYTTASGHVLAGESIDQAFHREINEELGINIDIDNANLVEINVWKMDKIKNGLPFIDRAFANVYIHKIDKNFNSFNFQPEEVLGVVKINAKNCLDLLLGEIQTIKGLIINQDTSSEKEITLSDFLVQDGELAIIKYGKILQSVLKEINNKD